MELVQSVLIVLVLSTAQSNAKGVPFSRRYGKICPFFKLLVSISIYISQTNFTYTNIYYP